jgi:hypothetical protein
VGGREEDRVASTWLLNQLRWRPSHAVTKAGTGQLQSSVPGMNQVAN